MAFEREASRGQAEEGVVSLIRRCYISIHNEVRQGVRRVSGNITAVSYWGRRS